MSQPEEKAGNNGRNGHNADDHAGCHTCNVGASTLTRGARWNAAGCFTLRGWLRQTTVVPGATLVIMVDAPPVALEAFVTVDDEDADELLLLLLLELEPPAFATFCSVPVRYTEK